MKGWLELFTFILAPFIGIVLTIGGIANFLRQENDWWFIFIGLFFLWLSYKLIIKYF